MNTPQINPFEILDSKLTKIESLLLEMKHDQLDVSARNSNHEEEILNIKQASEVLNLAIPTIYGLVSRRELISYKRAKKLYFKRSELLQWIQSGKRKSISEIQTTAKTLNSRK